MTKARIYQPSKTAMQSGQANTKKWVLEFEPQEKKAPDPLMGWAGSGDTLSQLKLRFSTREEAEDFAKRKGLKYNVFESTQRKKHIQSYGGNFK